ncbi:MAG: DNA recombination protein RmuC [Erysipelotrichaceae bacterium]|nr:DNA recombination protein RmuC [Erysipelotrichaceae bacterium]
MNDSLLLIIMAGLFTVSIIVILIIVLNNAKKTNDLNNELTRSVFEIQKNINRDFTEFNRSLNTDFSNFSERVNSNIIQSHKTTSEVFNSITEKIARIDEAQKNINALSEDVVSLQNILTDKKSRGTFGEIELYSLLEASFGNNTERCQKQYRLPNGSIADAVIFGGNTLKLICIDSKFPLENYRRMNDGDLSASEREKILPSILSQSGQG